MSTKPSSLPSFSTLYWNDFGIRRWANTFGFSLIVAAGVRWATQPVSNAPITPDNTFDAELGTWVPVGALVVAVVAMVLLVRRYLLVKRTFTQGATIKGIVEHIEISSRENDTDRTPGQKRSYTRTYWADLVYTFAGKERKVRLKLPNSGFTFGLVKGGETDLMVLESRPDKPLIRSVYLRRS
ncbi:MAG TPA: hypothetical protein VLE43_20050 [Candidatus Saccharimonadia bacterium]|nr:hypothetical protein [Candidatus Saccharimonadia bacterium]